MQTAFILQVGAVMVLWLSLAAWVKLTYPDSGVGRWLATIC